LALPCLPCKDLEEHVSEKKLTAYNQKENLPTKEHKEDNCTPFCHCNCCSTPCYYTNFIKEKAIAKVYIVKKFTLQDEVFTSSNIHNIWQPPKV
jgi:hypothetical protein